MAGVNAGDFKPVLAIDFDGVVNPYSKGWQGGELYETEVTRGFFEWAAEAERAGFVLVIYSSRSKEPAKREAMRKWLEQRMLEWIAEQERMHSPLRKHRFQFTYSAEKPPAWLTIDDRCVLFDASLWKNPALQPEAMSKFRSWCQDAK